MNNAAKKAYDKWSEEERQILYTYIETTQQSNKKFNWVLCAKMLQNRTPRQCYDFFVLNNKMRSEEKHHKWSKFEELLLLQQPSKGLSWKQFQQAYFPNLSVSQLKNKYNRLNVLKLNNSADRPASIQQQSLNDSFETMLNFDVDQLHLCLSDYYV